MWIQVKTAPNLMLAEMWKEFFEGEGVSTQIVPEELSFGEMISYRILIPKEKDHVVKEVLRKL